MLLGSSAAQADWQYTRWGMTEQEVVAASEGQARKPKRPDTYEGGSPLHLLEAPYKTGDFAFVAKFNFDRFRRLETVKLQLRNIHSCPALQGTLSNIYGPPKVSTTSLGRFAKWWDSDNGNVLILSDYPGMWCYVQYSVYKRPGEKGGL
ncbi:hypothetical protein ATC00_04705 [Sinorhizobium americanum]|nr:hypothetical protein ATC00_04705 [Sinorhizobium americanum]